MLLFPSGKMGSVWLHGHLFLTQTGPRARRLSYQFCVLHTLMAWDDVTFVFSTPHLYYLAHHLHNRDAFRCLCPGQWWPWPTLSIPVAISGNEGRKEFIKLVVGFSMSEFPRTPPPCYREKRTNEPRRARVSNGTERVGLCGQPNCLPAFSI